MPASQPHDQRHGVEHELRCLVHVAEKNVGLGACSCMATTLMIRSTNHARGHAYLHQRADPLACGSWSGSGLGRDLHSEEEGQD
jgi:hypothetical protein